MQIFNQVIWSNWAESFLLQQTFDCWGCLEAKSNFPSQQPIAFLLACRIIWILFTFFCFCFHSQSFVTTKKARSCISHEFYSAWVVKNSFIPSSLKTHSFLFIPFWLWAQLDCENKIHQLWEIIYYKCLKWSDWKKRGLF